MNTFGVTYTDISAQVHNLSITNASSPDIDGVTDMISFYAAEIAREADVVGIDVTSIGSGDSEYTYAKQALIAGVCGEVLVARARGDESAGAFYTKKYRSYISTLRKRPQVQQDTGEGPNLARSIISPSNPNKRFYKNRIVGDIINGNSL